MSTQSQQQQLIAARTSPFVAATTTNLNNERNFVPFFSTNQNTIKSEEEATPTNESIHLKRTQKNLVKYSM